MSKINVSDKILNTQSSDFTPQPDEGVSTAKSIPKTKFKGQFIKEKTVQAIRQFFLEKNFHEIDTPSLLPSIPLEPNLYPLKTTWTHQNIDFFFATSPESSLKKLIAKGVGNCFSISKVVRDLEDIGPTHNLEFLMLEWYEMDKNYQDIALTTQDLIIYINRAIRKYQRKRPTKLLTYKNQSIDLTPPWHSFTLSKLFSDFANMDLSKNLDFKSILKTAKHKGYNVNGVTSWEPLYTQIFINEIENKLPQDKPVIIFDYPTQTSPLCSPCPTNPGFSQRFEFYIGGMEIGNAYTESTSSKDILKHTLNEQTHRQSQNLPTHPFDKDFINACNSLPPCTGIGLGVDRLAMLMANTSNIEDVLYFPTSKLISNTHHD